jgi:hypothetical protein
MGTMRRSLLRRVFAAVLAPWVVVVMSEPAALHECAMHSAHAIPASAAHTHGMSAHVHGMTGSEHLAPQGSPSHDAASKYCTCLGGCCAATILALPGVAELSFAPIGIRAERPAESAERSAPATTEHLLPFANGPPATRA